jgi:hypothetical protein
MDRTGRFECGTPYYAEGNTVGSAYLCQLKAAYWSWYALHTGCSFSLLILLTISLQHEDLQV